MTPARGLLHAAAAVLAAILLAPVVSLAVAAADGTGELWPHLAAYVLPQAIRETGLLLVGVGLLVTALGTGTAWLVSAFAFPGRRFLDAALLLPLAVPTYVVAYAYLDLMHPLGPIQSGLRALLGLSSPRDLSLPDLRSLPGCILLLGFVLYPYVYLPTRALFLMRAGTLLEAARMLGAGPARTFFRVALPLARPAIALGVGLALMETLNDVGAAEFLGVRTLTVQVYATWVNRSDLPGAAQIALVMLAGVVGLVALERLARGKRGYAGSGHRDRPTARRPLSGWRAAAALALGTTPVLLGFGLPAGYLAWAAWQRLRAGGWPEALAAQTLNTVLYAGAATAVTVAVGLLVAAAPQLLGRRSGQALIRVAGLATQCPARFWRWDCSRPSLCSIRDWPTCSARNSAGRRPSGSERARRWSSPTRCVSSRSRSVRRRRVSPASPRPFPMRPGCWDVGVSRPCSRCSCRWHGPPF